MGVESDEKRGLKSVEKEKGFLFVKVEFRPPIPRGDGERLSFLQSPHVQLRRRRQNNHTVKLQFEKKKRQYR